MGAKGEAVNANDIIAALLAQPYPHDLMAIRKEAEGYFSEELARVGMDAYCTEEMMLKARQGWQKAQETAREWLKNNPPHNPIKNENG